MEPGQQIADRAGSTSSWILLGIWSLGRELQMNEADPGNKTPYPG